MIPRHCLPFSVGKFLSEWFSFLPVISSSELEKIYADTLGVPAVILLPSVRAGILMTILAANEPGMIAVGPAYTCDVVHEALALSGAAMRLVDLGPGGFLMPPENMCSATEPGCALVLSENYGIPYDQDVLRQTRGQGIRVRILDMAMSIPSPERMGQLEAGDVALFSFGWGKPMYAGWGGIVCFRDVDLAEKVYDVREQWIVPESFGLRFRRSFSNLLSVAMNQRYLYGLLHEKHLYSLYRNIKSFRNKQDHNPGQYGSIPRPASGREARSLPPEWNRATIGLNRRLALHNLHYAEKNAGLRFWQAEKYFKNLIEPGVVCGWGSKTLPQSHFPIRVPSAIRERMCDYLRGCGIDTSNLFPFPSGLSRDNYPHAAKAADEVITLPLGPTITLEEIEMISGCVKDGLRALGY